MSSVSSLVLHVVGARYADVEQAGAWVGLLSARLPSLRKLSLVLVGPEVGRGDLPEMFSMKMGRVEATFSLEQCDYKDYSQSKRWVGYPLIL